MRKFILLLILLLFPQGGWADTLLPSGETITYHLQVAATTSVAGAQVDVGGVNTLVITVTGISGDTVTIEGSNDTSGNFANPVNLQVVSSTGVATSGTITANGTFFVSVTAIRRLEAVLTHSAGTVTVDATGCLGPQGFGSTVVLSSGSVVTLGAGTASVGNVTTGVTATGVGATPLLLISLTNTAQVVKASAGQVYGLYISNIPNTLPTFVQIFSVPAASVTLGVTVPVLSYEIPGSGGYDLYLPVGINIGGTGISIAATTTAEGSTAPANVLPVVNVLFK